MKFLSPPAQAVLDAVFDHWPGGYNHPGKPRCVAAALRAAANEIVPETPPLFEPWAIAVDMKLLEKHHGRNESIRVRQCLMSIADELEGRHD